MLAESNIKPNKIEVIKLKNNISEVIISENIEEIIKEEEIFYKYNLTNIRLIDYNELNEDLNNDDNILLLKDYFNNCNIDITDYDKISLFTENFKLKIKLNMVNNVLDELVINVIPELSK